MNNDISRNAVMKLICARHSKLQICRTLNVDFHELSRFLSKENIKMPKISDSLYDGVKFGSLTVLNFSHQIRASKYYSCVCQCGKRLAISASNLRSGQKSCGCQKETISDSSFAQSKVGEKINRLTIVGFEPGKSKGYHFRCLCDCGKTTYSVYSHLANGKVKSCGCLQKELASAWCINRLKHFTNKHKWYFVQDGKKVSCRSGFEVLYAYYLQDSNIPFVYEPNAHKLSNGKSYLPDFFLPESNEFVELKGFLTEDNKTKLSLFKENHKITLIFWPELATICSSPFKSYFSYFRKAKRLNISPADFLGARLYQNS